MALELLLRWPKWAIAKVFYNQEKSFLIKKKVFKIKNTQTRSRTREHDQEHASTIKTRKSTIEIFVSKS